jgi:hypothetical protein
MMVCGMCKKVAYRGASNIANTGLKYFHVLNGNIIIYGNTIHLWKTIYFYEKGGDSK